MLRTMIEIAARLSTRPTILSLAIIFVIAQAASAQSTVAGGAAFTVVVKSDGTWAFGANSDGQLGDNTTTAHKSPVQVAGLSNIQAVAASGAHVLALTSNGTRTEHLCQCGLSLRTTHR